ncbi:OLC1v1014870C1 [Oldenlandia corymbosa var. corymbosa]|uniref:OLC1v1014870C1 n=1 Tax=Oldenlandia corymbosa var. corymbosa TaxID=529605 RepID=A0AAV1E289_OLDCO|nr:OLC1v1014870C1 [Oldenlandia corymbosa var. corymbosa]
MGMDAELNSMEMENDFDAEFTLAEVMEMESLYRRKMGGKPLKSEFFQELSDKFNNSVHRCGKPLIEWEQVAYWFQDRGKRDLKAEFLSMHRNVKKSNVPTNMLIDKSATDSALTIREEVKLQFPDAGLDLAIQTYYKPRDVVAAELSGLLYEAKSARDLAWYDVASFLNYRIVHSGELEVRVRFAGFDKDHDEWVNVKRGVRERSIPLEDSECEKVKVGDLVLCYRETEDLAVYRDARVIDIKRKLHDETEGCTCMFGVRFDFDFFEDQVRIKRLCGRPSS